MDDYRTYVQAVAREADGRQTILNRSPAHASVIISTIFRTTQRRVEILTGRLRDDIYGTPEVVESAVSFLSRNPEARMEIVSIEGVAMPDNHFLTALRLHRVVNDQVFLGRCTEAQARVHGFRFLVGDGQHYRFQSDPANTEAVVQFGRNETGRKLHEIFAALVESVPLAPLNSIPLVDADGTLPVIR
jgi:hypothetical protein